LEGDRVATLLVEAAATQAVDFREARTHDPSWWSYLRFVINAIEREKYRDWFRVAIHSHTAKLGIEKLTDDSFKKLSEESAKLTRDFFEILFPWKQSRDGILQEEAKTMREAWVAAFGDPDTPEVQDRIQRTADMLRSVAELPDQNLAKTEKAKQAVEEKAKQLKELIAKRNAARKSQRR
jgi:hypothetical protein